MRFFYHDVRDMPQAIVLACNLRRVVFACQSFLWTFFVAVGLLSVIGFRATGSFALSPSGLYAALNALFDTPLNLTRGLFWTYVTAGWWLGFGYLNAAVVRSAALELARDERGKLPPEPLLYRMAAASPVLAFGIPAAFGFAVLLWALLAHIPGAAGALILMLTLPLALICGMVAALGGLLVFFSAPMMPATAVVEGRDYLEAVTRPAGFVLQKPFRYLGYLVSKAATVALAALLGALVLGIAWALVAGCMIAVGADQVVYGAYKLSTSPTPLMEQDQLPQLAVASVFWASVAGLICWLAVVAQCADLLTYLLMRNRIEGTTFDQVAVVEERLRRFPTAVETAAEAEEARKRFDAAQAAKSDPAESPAARPAKAE